MSWEDKPSPGSRAVRASLGERGSCAWVFAAAVEMWAPTKGRSYATSRSLWFSSSFESREVWPRHNRDEGPQPHVARHTLHRGSPSALRMWRLPWIKAPEGCEHTRVHPGDAVSGAHSCPLEPNRRTPVWAPGVLRARPSCCTVASPGTPSVHAKPRYILGTWRGSVVPPSLNLSRGF